MRLVSRRNLLKYSAASAAGLTLFPKAFAHAQAPVSGDLSDKYITCFYQIGKDALERFAENQALPNGAQYIHIMSHSAPRKEGWGGRGKNVHACGESFKWAPAFD